MGKEIADKYPELFLTAEDIQKGRFKVLGPLGGDPLHSYSLDDGLVRRYMSDRRVNTYGFIMDAVDDENIKLYRLYDVRSEQKAVRSKSNFADLKLKYFPNYTNSKSSNWILLPKVEYDRFAKLIKEYSLGDISDLLIDICLQIQCRFVKSLSFKLTDGEQSEKYIRSRKNLIKIIERADPYLLRINGDATTVEPKSDKAEKSDLLNILFRFKARNDTIKIESPVFAKEMVIVLSRAYGTDYYTDYQDGLNGTKNSFFEIPEVSEERKSFYTTLPVCFYKLLKCEDFFNDSGAKISSRMSSFIAQLMDFALLSPKDGKYHDIQYMNTIIRNGLKMTGEC